MFASQEERTRARVRDLEDIEHLLAGRRDTSARLDRSGVAVKAQTIELVHRDQPGLGFHRGDLRFEFRSIAH